MVLFLSDRFERTGLMVFDPATGRVGRVTQSWVYAVARAKDQAAAGKVVAPFGRPCAGAQSTCTQIVVREADGTEHEITEPGWLHYEPALSPGGSWLAYVSNVTGNDEIFRINTDGSDNTRLTENVWEWDKHPSVSPDGSRIVFWSNRDGRKQIYAMNADGSGEAVLAPSPYNDWDPVWVK
jgi:Tol biopolymer transport system component